MQYEIAFARVNEFSTSSKEVHDLNLKLRKDQTKKLEICILKATIDRFKIKMKKSKCVEQIEDLKIRNYKNGVSTWTYGEDNSDFEFKSFDDEENEYLIEYYDEVLDQ